MVLEDRRLKVWEIAEAVGMSSEWAYHILSEELGMKKLSARWVSQLLMQDQKSIRVEMSEEYLACFQKYQDFLYWFMTTDETWIQYYHISPNPRQGFFFFLNMSYEKLGGIL